jgi:hypothetical protein
MMKFLHPSYVMVNCIECFSQRALYETIIEQLTGYERTAEKGFRSYLK